MTFNKTYKDFTWGGDERINITEVSGKGNSLLEILWDCIVYAQDWHGNPVELSMNDVTGKDFNRVHRDVARFVSETQLGAADET